MEQRPDIFKLNLDCFDHIFDYLALKDLGKFSQTCKAMKAAVGQYYKENYKTHKEYASIENGNLYLLSRAMGYSDYVQKLCISPDSEADDYLVIRYSDKIVMDITIRLYVFGFTESELQVLERILGKAEVLNINCENWPMSQSFYYTVPNVCNKLKRLHMHRFVCDDAPQTRHGNEWLLHKYPRLEHLEWTPSQTHGYKIHGIKEFFERNPNVRSFATDDESLWESHDLITESGVKLDDLTIEVWKSSYEGRHKEIQNVCKILDELYKKGVYKHLHLKFQVRFDKQKQIQDIIDEIISKNAVTSISLPKFNINFSNFENIVELQFPYYNGELFLDETVSYLKNLQRVDLGWAYLDEMLPFIYHSVKLKKLKVHKFLDENVSALDLAKMNKRREQLFEASKVTIFIEERFYLATKWASKLTDFHLIEMTRSTEHEWGHHFSPF